MSDSITILRSKDYSGVFPTKTWMPDGSVKVAATAAKAWTVQSLPLNDFLDLASTLSIIQEDPRAAAVRGVLRPDASVLARHKDEDYYARDLATFADAPHHWVLIDCDAFRPVSADPLEDPVGALQEFVRSALPPAFGAAGYFWQLSASAGRPGAEGVLKAHLWFWLDVPASSSQLKAWAAHEGLCKTPGEPPVACVAVPGQVDSALFNPVQLHYTAWPRVAPRAECPVPNEQGRRYGTERGLLSDAVMIDLSPFGDAEQGDLPPASAASPPSEDVRQTDDPILALLVEKGLVLRQTPRHTWFITCPCASEHSTQGNGTDCEYSPAGAGKYPRDYWMINCLHAGCRGRTQAQWLDKLGADRVAMLTAATERDFNAEGVPDEELSDFVGTDAQGAATTAVPPQQNGLLIDLDNLPKAQFAATDQANALRLITRHRHEMLVTKGRWFVWSGTHWVESEAAVYRRAWFLSRFVLADANLFKEKAAQALATGNEEDNERFLKIAENLVAWAKVSEDSARISAAVSMAKKVLEVPEDRFDADPWLLNCLNGTVDLRTGAIRPHAPADLITKTASAAYDSEAQCPEWERVIAQVCGEWGPNATEKPVTDFLQRWFGYCATGSVREPMFVVHYGGGSNGKSTVLSTISSLLGGYATTAAPKLLAASKGDRHPAEIADLHGRRMVTAHESEEGVALREDFIKAASGGDGEKLKARHMHADFFEFQPSAKMQLLTNHKPRVFGQDDGIWRRLALVPYSTYFGTEEDLAAGRAQYLKDLDQVQKLKAESPGILAWIVRGAVAWFSGGLAPPERVKTASLGYRTDSDRFGQFLQECCQIGHTHKAYITSPEGGLYTAYRAWSEENGALPWSKQRFLEALRRALPQSEITPCKRMFTCGRRSVQEISGVGLVEDWED